jgi:hypothetical protein
VAGVAVPYEHAPMHEHSVARPVARDGDIAAVATGLDASLFRLWPDDVRPAVEARLDEARRTGEPFLGIVAGVLLDLQTSRIPAGPDGSYAVRVEVTIGAPLVPLPG